MTEKNTLQFPATPDARYSEARYLVEQGMYHAAVDRLLLLTESGYSDADPLLSFIYRTGADAFEPDLRKALYYARRALEAGHPEGYMYVAHHYLHGLGVDRDPELAKNLYEAAFALFEHRTASLCLGRIHEFGLTASPDLDKALFFYLAAEKLHVAIATRRKAIVLWKMGRFVSSIAEHVRGTFVGRKLYRQRGESVFRRW